MLTDYLQVLEETGDETLKTARDRVDGKTSHEHDSGLVGRDSVFGKYKYPSEGHEHAIAVVL